MKWLKYLVLFVLAFFILGINTIAESESMRRDFKVAIIYPGTVGNYLEGKRDTDKIQYIRKIAPDAIVRSFFLNLEPGLSKPIIQDRAKKVNGRLEQFQPDLIIMNEAEVVEYIGVPYIYEKGKGNSIFLNVDDHEFQRISDTYKLSDPKFKDVLLGMVSDDKISFLAPIFNEISPTYKNIYVIQGGANMHGDEDYVVAELKQNFPTKNVEVFRANTNKDLRVILEELNKREMGILIDLLESPTDYTTGRQLTNKEIAQTYVGFNRKHLELSIKQNYAQYGFALSYILHLPKENTLDDAAPCNTCIRKFFNREKPDYRIQKIQNTLLVNKARIDSLNLDKFYNLSHTIKMILLEN